MGEREAHNRAIQEAFRVGTPIDEAMNEAFFEAVRLHRCHEVDMVMWEDGRVRYVDPWEIPLPGEDLHPDHPTPARVRPTGRLKQWWTREAQPMPEISRFFGIVVRMFVEAGGVHHRPHLHSYYGEHAAVFAIDEIERIGGSLPTRQERLVLAWIEIHQEALVRNWDALQSGQPPEKVEPLR